LRPQLKTNKLMKLYSFRIALLFILFCPFSFVQAQNWLTSGNPLGSTGILGATTNYGITFITNNTAQMYLTTGGKLGVQIQPLSNFHLYEKTKDTCFVRVSTALANKGGVLFGLYNNNCGIIKLKELTHFTINTNDLNRFTVLSDGRIGIGTDSPADQLDIYSGKIRLREGAQNKYLLASDINGTGTWTALNLQLTGSTLSLTHNGVGVDLSTLYSEGTGLTLSGTTFSHAAHTGDVTGASSLTVAKIQGRNVVSTAPTNGQILKWNNTASQWEPSSDNSNTYIAGTGILLSGSTFIAQTTSPIWNANQIQNFPVSTNGPDDGQVLKYDGTYWIPASDENTTYTAGSGINITGTTINNNAPDQTVVLSGSGATTVSGTYPNFNISSTDNDGQTLSIHNNTLTISDGNTVYLPDYTAETGIAINGTFPNFTIENTNPGDAIQITGTGATSVTGTYPNFTISSTDENTTYSAGDYISISNGIITNTAPNQTVTLAQGGATSISGIYPNFTISSTDNDNQTLALNGSDLSISNSNSVNLSSLNTDSQQLTLSENTLSITSGNEVTLPKYTEGTGIALTGNYPNFTIENTSPGDAISFTGEGATTVTGSYPNFTISSTDNNTTYSAGTGIDITTGIITNTAADQTVILNNGTGIAVSGTYPNFTINNTLPAQSYTAGSGISIANNTINSVWTKSGESIFNNNAQNVGIGIQNPQSALHIHGGNTGLSSTSKLIASPNPNPIPVSTGGTLQFTNPTTGTSVADGLIMGTFMNTAYIKQCENSSLDLYTNNQKRFSISGNGNVGIGTTANPTAKLEVNGNLKITDIPVLTQTTDFLTVDANGFIGKRNTASLADNLGNHIATMNINLGDKFLSATGENKGIKISSNNKISLLEESVNGFQISNNNEIPFRRGISIDNDNGGTNNNGNFNFWIHNWQNSAFNFMRRNDDSNTNFTNLVTIKQNGNVGINTTNPGAKLEVAHDDASGGMTINRLNATTAKSQITFRQNGSEKWSLGTDMSSENKNNFFIWDNTNSAARLFINENGNVGIGTTEPNVKLDVNGSIRIPIANNTEHYSPGIVLSSSDDFSYNGQYLNHYGFGFFKPTNGCCNGAYISGFSGVQMFTGGESRITVLQNGNVGIGTVEPGANLSVKNCGTFRIGPWEFQDITSGYKLTLKRWSLTQTGSEISDDAFELVVTTNNNTDMHLKGQFFCKEVYITEDIIWPDYVFAKDYSLMPLSEVEKFINKNSHLPDVPSAKQIKENGQSLGEMNTILLKKIEQLMLYILEQKKEIDSLKNDVQTLKTTGK